MWVVVVDVVVVVVAVAQSLWPWSLLGSVGLSALSVMPQKPSLL